MASGVATDGGPADHVRPGNNGGTSEWADHPSVADQFSHQTTVLQRLRLLHRCALRRHRRVAKHQQTGRVQHLKSCDQSTKLEV